MQAVVSVTTTATVTVTVIGDMALPTNGHHVHSDGYYSERGGVDEQQMMDALADTCEMIDGVSESVPRMGANSAYVEIECDGLASTLDDIESTANRYDAVVHRVDRDDGLVEIRR
jgi:hypothetical protein